MKTITPERHLQLSFAPDHRGHYAKPGETQAAGIKRLNAELNRRRKKADRPASHYPIWKPGMTTRQYVNQLWTIRHLQGASPYDGPISVSLAAIPDRPAPYYPGGEAEVTFEIEP